MSPELLPGDLEYLNAQAKKRASDAETWRGYGFVDRAGQSEALAARYARIAARLTELEADNMGLLVALTDLSERHTWDPLLGSCVCLPHEAARKLLRRRAASPVSPQETQ